MLPACPNRGHRQAPGHRSGQSIARRPEPQEPYRHRGREVPGRQLPCQRTAARRLAREAGLPKLSPSSPCQNTKASPGATRTRSNEPFSRDSSDAPSRSGASPTTTRCSTSPPPPSSISTTHRHLFCLAYANRFQLGEPSTAQRRWLRITAQSRISPPFGGLT